jgi:hypothetical protein
MPGETNLRPDTASLPRTNEPTIDGERCRIPSRRSDGQPRDLRMNNKVRKHEKAVKKIEVAVRKALGKGVSKKSR